jgi:hypothetical protein
MAPNFRENSYLSDNGFHDPRKGLDLLLSDKANSVPELKRWSHAGHIGLRGGSKLAYYLGDVACVWDADDDLAKRTIEFREHESTLNKHAVISWIELCVRLVEFADDVTEDLLFPFLRQHIEETPEQYQLGQLLCKLGLPELAKWYPLQITRREAQEKLTLEWNLQRVKEGKRFHGEAELWYIRPSMTDGSVKMSARYSKAKKYGKSSIASVHGA